MGVARATTAAAIVDSLRPGMTVFVSGMSGESTAFHDALKTNPERCAGVRFVGALFPGINRADYLGLSPSTRQRAYFMAPSLRPGLADGRTELMPLDYPGIVRDLESLPSIDLAIAQCSPPDAQGRSSFGVSCDFQPAVFARARRRVAHLNRRMPMTRGSAAVYFPNFDASFEAEQPLVTYDAGTPTEAMRAHARHVAALVRDGDTLEFGVGKLQAAILGELSDRRDLKVWSGMASSPLLPLLDRGIIKGRAQVNIGVALGDAAFYERVGRDECFFFRPVTETHDVRRIGGIDSFCAINSAVEVDLFGQVNADTVNGRQVAGVGGLPAFVAGALMSRGGRSIIALPATTEDGKSRVVGRLDAGCLAALPRQAADVVVTEHGVAELRSKSMQARAAALIAIAAPEHREALAREWRDCLAAV